MVKDLLGTIRPFYDLGDWQGVVNTIDISAIDEINDPSVLLLVAQSYRFLGLPELGVPAYAKCLDLSPGDLLLRLTVVDVLLSLQEWGLANELLIVDDWPSDCLPQVLIARARCQAQLDSAEKAELQLLELQNYEGIDFFWLGVAFTEVNLKLGNIPLAQSCLEKLNDVRPNSEEHALLQLDLLSAQWVQDDIKLILDELMDVFSANRRVVNRICQTYVRFVKFDEAYATYKLAFKHFSFEGHLAEGFLQLLVSMSRLDELRKAIAQDPLIIPPVELRLLEAECLLNCDLDGEAAQLISELPESLVSLYLLADLRHRQGDWESALECRRRMYFGDPSSPDCQFDYASALLSSFCWREAWPLYESRFYRKSSVHVTPAGIRPLNQFISPRNRKVLVFGEQGLGDTVMMASMLQQAIHESASCSVFVQPRLEKWFAEVFVGASVVSRIDAAKFEGMDSCYGIGSLGQFYRNSSDQFPGNPYLQISDQAVLDAWRLKLQSLGPGLKIGVAWRGGRGVAAKRRSLDLVELLPLLDVAQDAVWVNLQYSHSDSQAELQCVKSDHGWTIHQFEGIAQDMYQTAALTQVLDLVITVQQTALHVAGAVGAKALVLLPLAPEWRYGCSGSSMPWYNSVELFRQDQAGDWNRPITEVKQRLAALTEARHGHNGVG